jgi:membrane associated rhomboid family serine protease
MTALIVVIAVNVVVSLFGFRAHSEKFLFIPHQVARGEHRVGMLLAHFAHAGPAHLAFNMLAL